VLSPGAIATELATEALGEAGLKAYGSMTGFQRMGDPAELGAAAAFLASSDSSFMTGQRGRRRRRPGATLTLYALRRFNSIIRSAEGHGNPKENL